MKTVVTIVDYGVGNVQSVMNALAKLGCQVVVSSSKKDIERCDALILPGVGAFETAMTNLTKHGLIPMLNEEVLDRRKPILGICLGMQLLGTTSLENGVHAGLGWIDATVEKLSPSENLTVPHVGWNTLSIRAAEPLFSRVSKDPNFYFDHSFHFVCQQQHVLASCVYGGEFTAAVKKNNIHGVQFHPEKSQLNGLRLFRAFINSVSKTGHHA